MPCSSRTGSPCPSQLVGLSLESEADAVEILSLIVASGGAPRQSLLASNGVDADEDGEDVGEAKHEHHEVIEDDDVVKAIPFGSLSCVLCIVVVYPSLYSRQRRRRSLLFLQ